MNGINAFFHAGSAFVAVWLVYLLLRIRRSRDVLRELVQDQQAARATAGVATRKVRVATPQEFLREVAAALGAEFEQDGRAAAPAKIRAAPFLDLFVTHGLFLIRCTESKIELEVGSVLTDGETAALAAALGGQVQVVARPRPS
jgi:hypothetical protein